MRRSLLALVLLSCAALGNAQELEYKMEMGAALGTDFYLGDCNSTPFKNPSVMGGLIVRKIFNPRMVIKCDLAVGHLRGSSSGYYIPTDAWTPGAEGGVPTTVKFKRNVVDLGAQFEFNFWGFGTGEGYKGNSRITPYALAGLGVTLATGGGGGASGGLNFPVGLGVKYKVKPRVNVGAEWTFRFTTSDKLDENKESRQLSHPYGIKSVGLKNKDAYSFFMVYITYDMCPKYRKCNN